MKIHTTNTMELECGEQAVFVWNHNDTYWSETIRRREDGKYECYNSDADDWFSYIIDTFGSHMEFTRIM